ncbi:MAG TPA: nucleotidyl transferase AbiEii/AbiGii toxin family protein [Thermoanaerobaculia bacterium]|nr:nucleotidyl transferase AbiEii/AbiGii toxin family protein [Thermoanaerobaculia bacterium]
MKPSGEAAAPDIAVPKRPQHRNVLAVLGALRADLLSSCKFFFGGGTRIFLELDEYRESADADFLCSDASGYGELRLIATQQGYDGLFAPEPAKGLHFPREMKVDQYGIRFPVALGDDSLRVELIREARIELGPGVRPDWSPVECLSMEDCYAEKLLANSDRWSDRQTLSRDLIDLAFLRLRIGPVPETVWRRVRDAYKSAPEKDLTKALDFFMSDPVHQQHCLKGLRMEGMSEQLSRGLALLHQDLT